jgi:hypothetical protein
MKKRIFLLLVLALTANICIATPAIAYNWNDAKRDAASVAKVTLATGKAALGATALGIGGAVAVTCAKGIAEEISSNPDFLYDLTTNRSAAFALMMVTMITSTIYAGCKAFQSAWYDIKNINNLNHPKLAAAIAATTSLISGAVIYKWLTYDPLIKH